MITKRVYLSGRMSGLSQKEWRWRFLTADMTLDMQGYDVINPADNIISRHLWLYRLVGYRFTLWYDLRLLKKCNYIHMVCDDWKKSRGARLERLKARDWGIKELNDELENWRK